MNVKNSLITLYDDIEELKELIIKIKNGDHVVINVIKIIDGVQTYDKRELVKILKYIKEQIQSMNKIRKVLIKNSWLLMNSDNKQELYEKHLELCNDIKKIHEECFELLCYGR